MGTRKASVPDVVPVSVFAGETFFDIEGEDGADASAAWEKTGAPARKHLVLATKEVHRCWNLYRKWAGSPLNLEEKEAARIARLMLEAGKNPSTLLPLLHAHSRTFTQMQFITSTFITAKTADSAVSRRGAKKKEVAAIHRGFLSNASDIDDHVREAVLIAYRIVGPDPDAEVVPTADEMVVFATTCARTRANNGRESWSKRLTPVIDAAAVAMGLPKGPEYA